MAGVKAKLRALRRPPAGGGHDAVIHVSMPLYVRDGRGRVVTLEVAPQATAWWTAAHALITFDDPGDASDYRLMLHGEPLRPRRSLAASGVRHGDTLDLIAVTARPRRLRRRRTP
jgi:hypothetical protein